MNLYVNTLPQCVSLSFPEHAFSLGHKHHDDHTHIKHIYFELLTNRSMFHGIGIMALLSISGSSP